MIKTAVFISSFSLLFIFAGCSKSSTTAGGCGYSESTLVATPSEILAIQTYLSTNSLTATQHSSGIFYTIISPGSGASPAICSTVTVKYSGFLFSGFKFAEDLTGSTFKMGQLIAGWQKGMELIMKGGSIILYIPPSLGYGATQNGIIPANSYLIFSVQMTNVL